MLTRPEEELLFDEHAEQRQTLLHASSAAVLRMICQASFAPGYKGRPVEGLINSHPTAVCARRAAQPSLCCSATLKSHGKALAWSPVTYTECGMVSLPDG